MIVKRRGSFVALISVLISKTMVRIELNAQRLLDIKVEISKTSEPIFVFGDSIVERAVLLASFCGHPVVNAGGYGLRVPS